MKKFLALLSLLFLLPMVVFTADSMSFYYVLDLEASTVPIVYFTNNLDETDMADRITEYYISADSTERGFYMHIETNNDNLDGIELSFSGFKNYEGKYPTVKMGDTIYYGIPFGVSVTNVYNYYSADKPIEITNQHYDNDKLYSVGFGINEAKDTHYVYRIEYTGITDDYFTSLPPQDFISTITVSVSATGVDEI